MSSKENVDQQVTSRDLLITELENQSKMKDDEIQTMQQTIENYNQELKDKKNELIYTKMKENENDVE